MFKTRLETFGNDFGHFCIFENFLIFWKHFEVSTLHGTLGRKIFPKNVPQNMFKTFLDTFANNFGHFWKIWKLFDFSKTSRRLDPPWKTRQKKFRKNYPKTCSKHVGTLLGTILGIFGKFENCSTFWKHFEDSTLHGKLGKKNSEKLSQNMFKTRLDTFGNIFGQF